MEEYKEKELFKFKTIEFQYKDSSIYLNRFNEINLVHEEREKKSTTLTIIIIVAAIILAIAIAIFIIFFIRKSSTKNKDSNDLDNITKYDNDNISKPKTHKRTLTNKKNNKMKNKDNDGIISSNQEMQTIEFKPKKKRSIKNKNDSDKF